MLLKVLVACACGQTSCTLHHAIMQLSLKCKLTIQLQFWQPSFYAKIIFLSKRGQLFDYQVSWLFQYLIMKMRYKLQENTWAEIWEFMVCNHKNKPTWQLINWWNWSQTRRKKMNEEINIVFLTLLCWNQNCSCSVERFIKAQRRLSQWHLWLFAMKTKQCAQYIYP